MPSENRAIKYRIYPDEEQQRYFVQTFGCVRFVWNQMLSDEKFFYNAADKHFVPTPAKYKKQYPWLCKADSLALANAQLDLNKAFSGFFNAKTGYPQYKSKHKSKRSYTTNNQNGTIELVDKGIRLPKAGIVKAKLHRLPSSHWKLKSATVSLTPSGKYYCSVLFSYETPEPEKLPLHEDRTLGLDYSSPHFYVDSNGVVAGYNHFFREAEERLARAQRRLSRMVKGSSNYNKQRIKVARIHEKIAERRKDFCHKLSREITNSYDYVFVEDLHLRGLAGSLNLGKATNDNGFGMFRTMLSYKLAAKGGALITIDKWYASSKRCNDCGFVNKGITLKTREWDCPQCGVHHDRDVNAALNIKEEGIRVCLASNIPSTAGTAETNACGDDVRHDALRGRAIVVESGSSLL